MNLFSVSDRSWILKKYNQDDVIFFKDNYSLDEITSKLLSIRNIKKDEVKSFLNPSIKNFLPNPFILNDMEKSSKKVSKAINNNLKIGIFGDYDVDGASATALLGNYFSALGTDYITYIPDRKKEGYGPSINAFKYFIENKIKLIFTVDCGTLSFDAIEYAKKNNIDFEVIEPNNRKITLKSYADNFTK